VSIETAVAANRAQRYGLTRWDACIIAVYVASRAAVRALLSLGSLLYWGPYVGSVQLLESAHGLLNSFAADNLLSLALFARAAAVITVILASIIGLLWRWDHHRAVYRPRRWIF
jgi:tetrahydromethanopterin S-methyltransferase subunit C